MASQYLTKEGLEKLEKELEELKSKKLPEVVERIAAAKEFLINGVKYSFPAKLGEYTPGIATGVGRCYSSR